MRNLYGAKDINALNVYQEMFQGTSFRADRGTDYGNVQNVVSERWKKISSRIKNENDN